MHIKHFGLAIPFLKVFLFCFWCVCVCVCLGGWVRGKSKTITAPSPPNELYPFFRKSFEYFYHFSCLSHSVICLVFHPGSGFELLCALR